MKTIIKPFLAIIIWVQIGCNAFFPNDNDPLTESNVFILCEGNFGQFNASLWMANPEQPIVNGPIYQNQTGKVLGDVGQSMTLSDDQLYVVNNTSHSIEIFDLSGDQAIHTQSIDFKGTSPRYMVIHEGKGYVTAWNSKGILVINLSSNSLDKTIDLDGMPEDILIHDNHFYVSITMKPDWSFDNRVLKLSLDGSIVSTYTVISGPGRMAILDGKLFVASAYYDANWNTFTGNNTIDLSSGTVTTKYLGEANDIGSDLIVFNDKIYRSFKGGVAQLNGDLTMNKSQTIGSSDGIYSAAAVGNYIFIGQTDYVAPDTVYVFNENNEMLQTYEVGAIPGDFILYEKEID